MRRGLFLASIFLTVIVTGGCGSGHVPVSGVVTFNGTPIAGAQVTFISEDGKNSSFATTSDTGAFELLTGQTRGAAPGQYKVTVVKSPQGASTPSTIPGDADYMKDMMTSKDKMKKSTTGAMMPGAGRPGMPGAGMMPGGMVPGAAGAGTVNSELPQVYANGASTPIVVTIPHDGPIMLELKGDAPKAPAKK